MLLLIEKIPEDQPRPQTHSKDGQAHMRMPWHIIMLETQTLRMMPATVSASLRITDIILACIDFLVNRGHCFCIVFCPAHQEC